MAPPEYGPQLPGPPGPAARGPPSPRYPQCPHCKGAVYRVPRHPFDRFLALFVTLRRYRCGSPRCGWGGLLHERPPAPGEAGSEPYAGGNRMLDVSRSGPAAPAAKAPR